MVLRCKLDGLLLDAWTEPDTWFLTVSDGGEQFRLEALEALFYQLVEASEGEVLALERPYRLLRRADDFRWAEPAAVCPG